MDSLPLNAPEEILSMIVLCFQPGRDTRTLARLSRTCTTFHRIAQPSLYRDIFIQRFRDFEDLGNVKKLLDTFYEHPELAGLVKSVRARCTQSGRSEYHLWGSESFHNLSNKDILVFNILSKLPELQRMDLSEYSWSIKGLAAFLHWLVANPNLPNIRHIELRLDFIEKIVSHAGISNRAYLSSLRPLFQLQALESIAIRRAYSLSTSSTMLLHPSNVKHILLDRLICKGNLDLTLCSIAQACKKLETLTLICESNHGLLFLHRSIIKNIGPLQDAFDRRITHAPAMRYEVRLLDSSNPHFECIFRLEYKGPVPTSEYPWPLKNESEYDRVSYSSPVLGNNHLCLRMETRAFKLKYLGSPQTWAIGMTLELVNQLDFGASRPVTLTILSKERIDENLWSVLGPDDDEDDEDDELEVTGRLVGASLQNVHRYQIIDGELQEIQS
ncbi:hypothetical protein P154DRAFT_579679 [Amniculicola lignicola CBS 123094]|uniref:F-box domain-containing protein n=1 Tax=Amniculicola lignicola CBS 123094 TaxID=1392246 RepID=A0A6A5W4E6_9PLEO|nr:hypothetical protein P154DRAFT_579679 [Amniculicola lignicola CBS 123094]